MHGTRKILPMMVGLRKKKETVAEEDATAAKMFQVQMLLLLLPIYLLHQSYLATCVYVPRYVHR